MRMRFCLFAAVVLAALAVPVAAAPHAAPAATGAVTCKSGYYKRHL